MYFSISDHLLEQNMFCFNTFKIKKFNRIAIEINKIIIYKLIHRPNPPHECMLNINLKIFVLFY
jgi:hypothetical protein